MRLAGLPIPFQISKRTRKILFAQKKDRQRERERERERKRERESVDIFDIYIYIYIFRVPRILLWKIVFFCLRIERRARELLFTT